MNKIFILTADCLIQKKSHAIIKRKFFAHSPPDMARLRI